MPFTTAPYPRKIWEKITACAERVEKVFATNQVQLTMGGEPTFVPINPTGAEWNTSALGPTKLDYARRFARQLINDAFPGAVILEISGKLYPGEALPRWAVLVQWRADKKPVWRDVTRIRANTEPGTHTVVQTQTFAQRLAKRLSFAQVDLLPLAEQTAPDSPVGYVLPLDHDGEKWTTDNWAASLKARTVLLFPGDSLAGLRLPLGSLAPTNLGRAMTVEIRNGTLTIFIPPLSLDAYLELMTAIEETLAKLDLKDIVLGGYAPPLDPKLCTLGLASDPGVIEVNVAICANWEEYDRQLRQIYEAAHAIGLCARKLQFNGRQTGTGGGAHLVFGGPLGLTSPFFSVPALLPSLIRYFQHHPALSYVFTGQYMGPSSQAPRIDESTFEALYELEIACAGAEQLGSPQNLALFDLLFRDLLMDRTGNTHRAEISVDKLWNPFSGNGRLGLVELRAFETNPSCAAQSLTALFIRAILARLVADPFRAPFIRWGGELHDRFFLPAFVWQDLTAVCADLRAHGIEFDAEWLRPLWEFRFPKLGEMVVQTLPLDPTKGKPEEITVTFRQALEAWPLLGEQPSGAGTSRSVDASMDRLEASVDNAAALGRGILLINGLPCEFRPVEDSPFEDGAKRSGVSAAGIRFRSYYLHPALHPHVPVHAPLLLEWIDKAHFTVVAAARWHVWNPRSVPYTSRPEYEDEALVRFTERWEVWPHTLGQPRFVPKIEFPPESRFTLDLRRYPSQSRG